MNEFNKMDNSLNQLNKNVYTTCDLKISDFQLEPESKEYHASRFDLSGRKIIYRSAKITPKKIGQFVTFWKRNEGGPIEPFDDTDLVDFFVVNVQTENLLGQFVFPKSILIKRGIIYTEKKEGKRAFRVYPNWDQPKSKQAERTQKWQLDYFYEWNDSLNLDSVLELYNQTSVL